MSPKFVLGAFLFALGMTLFSNGKLNTESLHPALSSFWLSWGKKTVIIAIFCVLAGSVLMLFQ